MNAASVIRNPAPASGRAPAPAQSTIHPYCRQVEVKQSTLARCGMKPKPIPEVVNSAQTAESQEITKAAALKEAQKSRNPPFARAKEKYENQYERQDQGQLPRNEGNNQGGGWKDYE
jgi:hypothetical protein